MNSALRRGKARRGQLKMVDFSLTRFITYDTLIAEVKNEYKKSEIECCA